MKIPAGLEGPSDPDALLALYQPPGCGMEGAVLTAYAERREGVGLLVWPDDVMEGGRTRPLGLLPATATLTEAEWWVWGHRASQSAAYLRGKDQGRREMQAGFRAFCGAASHSDLELLAKAIEDATGKGL